MGDKISRRSFLKGTGKTILTAGVLSSGVALSTSTTPLKTVAPKASGLAVKLSSKAKAYRHYLQAIKGMATMAALEIEANKNPKGTDLDQLEKRTHQTAKREFKNFARPHQPESGVKSLARNSFESAINRKRSGAGQKTNIYSDHIAHQTEYRSAIGRADTDIEKDKWRGKKAVQKFNTAVHDSSKDLHSTARSMLAIEKLIERRKKKQKKKLKGGSMMGGGKFIEGQETPRNPTGMSLITRRSILM